MADLVVVVRIVLPGGQLQERLGDELALAVPGAAHRFVQLEDGVGHVDVRGQAFRLGFPLVVVHGTWSGTGGWGKQKP